MVTVRVNSNNEVFYDQRTLLSNEIVTQIFANLRHECYMMKQVIQINSAHVLQ